MDMIRKKEEIPGAGLGRRMGRGFLEFDGAMRDLDLVKLPSAEKESDRIELGGDGLGIDFLDRATAFSAVKGGGFRAVPARSMQGRVVAFDFKAFGGGAADEFTEGIPFHEKTEPSRRKEAGQEDNDQEDHRDPSQTVSSSRGLPILFQHPGRVSFAANAAHGAKVLCLEW